MAHDRFDVSSRLNSLVQRVLGASGPKIRMMRHDDLKDVLRIIRLHDSDDYQAAKASFDKARFDLPERVTAHFLLLDPENGRPVGVSGYYLEDLESQGLYWLGWTYVNPFHRGKGYGSKLMKVVMEVVRDLGGRKMYLTTSGLEKYSGAVKFYERYGFAIEGRLLDFYSDGDDQLIMGCRLQSQDESMRKQSHHQAMEEAQEEPSRPSKSEDDGKVVFEF